MNPNDKNKNIWVIAVLATIVGIVFQTSNSHAQSVYQTYNVQNASKNGYYVKAEGNALSIELPSGERKTLFAPFIKKAPNFIVDLSPRGDIICSWSPTGKYVAIFVPQTRITDTYVFDTSSNEQLPQKLIKSTYPDWYEDVKAAHDSPYPEWSDNSTLRITQECALKGGGTQTLTEVLNVFSDFFSIDVESATGVKGPIQSGTPDSKPKMLKPQHSLEF
jgi:hypothetical protein